MTISRMRLSKPSKPLRVLPEASTCDKHLRIPPYDTLDEVYYYYISHIPVVIYILNKIDIIYIINLLYLTCFNNYFYFILYCIYYVCYR